MESTGRRCKDRRSIALCKQNDTEKTRRVLLTREEVEKE